MEACRILQKVRAAGKLIDHHFCPWKRTGHWGLTRAENQKRRKPNNKNHTPTRYMNTNRTLRAGAAIAGILAGGIINKANAVIGTKPSKATFTAGVLADEKGETHECKGHNSCKGKGGCKSGDNS